MLIQEFELLSYAEKDELVLDYGTFLVNYDEGDDLVDVYELFDFYVAICYKVNNDLKVEITSSTHPDKLPHLVKIERIW